MNRFNNICSLNKELYLAVGWNLTKKCFRISVLTIHLSTENSKLEES